MARNPIVHWLGLSHQVFVLEHGFFVLVGVVLLVLVPYVLWKPGGSRIVFTVPFGKKGTPGRYTSIGLNVTARRAQPGANPPQTHFQIHTRTIREIHPVAPIRPSDRSDPPAPRSDG